MLQFKLIFWIVGCRGAQKESRSGRLTQKSQVKYQKQHPTIYTFTTNQQQIMHDAVLYYSIVCRFVWLDFIAIEEIQHYKHTTNKLKILFIRYNKCAIFQCFINFLF